jgi:hypothetical protein
MTLRLSVQMEVARLNPPVYIAFAHVAGSF